MKICSLVFTLAIFPYGISTAFADAVSSEINHLISYVSASSCSFIRNGSSHAAAEAVEHMQKKYRYLKRRINSAEKFIELSASKSTMTGKPYMIKCSGEKEVQSSVWLREELQRFRQGNQEAVRE